jgi:colanic acid/amylovoran biosynthesis glycosyltransferase
MKVAYLCSLYPAVSHTFVQREVEELREQGVEVTTFSIHRAGQEQILSQADRRAHETTAAILPVGAGALLSAHLATAGRHPRAYAATLALALRLAPDKARGLLWQLFYFAESVLLWRELQSRGLRHVHAHMGNVGADVALLATALGGKIEPKRKWGFSLTLHGPDELFDIRHFRLAAKAERATFVVCISDFTRSQLMAICPPATWPKLHVVHVGIPLRRFTRLDARARHEPARLLFVGRLVAQKGQAVLLEAVAALTERGREVELTLAGDGPTRATLERLAERLGVAGRVRFLGAVGQEQIGALYEQASIFCLPSFAEGLPTVLMEALAMELPVISTRINGAPELVRDGETGLLVTPGRADELAAAIERLIEDPSLAARLAGRGRDLVSREFEVGRCAGELRMLLAQTAAAEDGA